MKRTALITGVSGQDGSWLSEFLLNQGYKVYGLKRRTSTDVLWRVKHLFINPDFIILENELTDPSSVYHIIGKVKPDEIYNTAAMSHVASSFEQPTYTFDVNARSVIYLLDAIRDITPCARFLQCSTSEMFGSNYTDDGKEKYQDENTLLSPNSPYALSKIASHHAVDLYRKSYNIWCCSSICFNHESVPKHTPIIVKKDNLIDVLPIEDIFHVEGHRYEGILLKYKNCLIWDGDDWTEILNGTVYKDKNKKTNIVQTVSQVCETTLEHSIFMSDGNEKDSQKLNIGDILYNSQYPEYNNNLFSIDTNLAKFIGFIVGDGTINKDGRICLTGCDKNELINIANLVVKNYGWKYNLYNGGPGMFNNCKKDIWKLSINNDKNFGKWIRSEIYTTHSHEKRVPIFILNNTREIKKAFFDGYYLADGRKAGWEKYDYKGFTTSSATLCLGLLVISNEILSSNQIPKVKCEYRNSRRYYYVQYRSPKSKDNHPKMKNLNQVIKLMECKTDDGWFFDLQTTSQSFAIGPNIVKIHNSPKRGEEFVTKKITKWIGQFVAHGGTNINALLDTSREEYILINDHRFPKLRLGNMNTYRDWSDARDMVRGMWMMLQRDQPEDFVLGSGVARTVKDFCQKAFGCVGISNFMQYIYIDPAFYRPCEVTYLRARTEKANKVLGWQPEISFDEMVEDMVKFDIEEAKKEMRV